MPTKNRKIIITLSLIVLLVVGGSSVIAIEKNKKEEQKIYNEKIENHTSKINEKYNELTLEKDESKKLEELKNIVTDRDEYKSGTEKDEKVLNAYEYSINELKKEFKENNGKTLKENTSLDLENENKDSLVKKSGSLKALKGKVKTQENIIYSKKEKEVVDKKIESLLKQYEDKINQLDKVAKEKQEAEEKAKEEQAVKAAEEAQEQKVQEQQAPLEAQGGTNYRETDISSNNGNYSSENTQSPNSSSQNNTTNSNDSSSNSSSSTKVPIQAAPSAPSNSSGKDYGWSAGQNGEGKHDTWTQQNPDGSVTAGTGKGSNEEEMGGWEID